MTPGSAPEEQAPEGQARDRQACDRQDEVGDDRVLQLARESSRRWREPLDELATR